MLPPQAPPPTEFHLLVEPLFKVRRWWPRPAFPIQNVPFAFGLRITNQSERPFPGGALTNIHVHDVDLAGGCARSRCGLRVDRPPLWRLEASCAFEGKWSAPSTGPLH